MAGELIVRGHKVTAESREEIVLAAALILADSAFGWDYDGDDARRFDLHAESALMAIRNMLAETEAGAWLEAELDRRWESRA